MASGKIENRRLILRLLSPSWLSGLLVILTALCLTAGAIASFSLENSALKQQLTEWQQAQPQKPLTTPEQTLPENDKPRLQDTWPLLIVWAGVGLLVYFVAINVIQALGQAERLRQTMGYVNARPDQMIHAAIEHLVLRLVALIATLALAGLLLKRTLPYAITAAHASAVDLLSPNGATYALLAFGIIVLNLHVIVIFSRLTAGRVRVFSTEI